MLAKIKETPDFVRNITGKEEAPAVINVNQTGLDAYRKKRNREKELNAALDDINTLKTDIADIKNLLIQLTLK